MRKQRLHQTIPAVVSLFLPLSAGLIVAGCQPPQTGTAGALGIPPENKARILSRSLLKSSEKLHWKWSLIGERSWMEPSNTNGIVQLRASRPFNDPNMKGGTNVWETDLIVSQTGQGLQWESRLHGSNGMTAESKGTVPGKLSDVSVALATDGLVPIPGETTLARIGNQEFRWKIDR